MRKLKTLRSNTKGGALYVPILPILGLIFITLKLTGHITWSWIWVLAPFWILFAVWLGIFLFIVLVAVFASRRR